jgi:ABC transporter, permease protein
MKTQKIKRQYSPEHLQYLKKRKRDHIIVILSRIMLLIILFGIWELAAQLKWIDPFIMSSPSRIAKTIVNLFVNDNLLMHIGVTLYETCMGFLLSTLIGTLVAILLWWSEYLRKVLDPYIVVLNSLPKIALGPVIIVWFGAGTKSIIFMAILICVIITILNMLTSFNSCDQGKILLLRSMGASKFQILRKLILPYSIPSFISVLKINVGMAWVGTIMGEYLVSRAGLGYLIVYGSQVFKLDLVMASTVILCVLAALMYLIVALLEKLVHRN